MPTTSTRPFTLQLQVMKQSVSGLKFKKMSSCGRLELWRVTRRSREISDGVILGGGTNHLIHAEGMALLDLDTSLIYRTEVSISNADVGGQTHFTDDITLFSQIGGTVSART